MNVEFPFSDTIGGYVTGFDRAAKCFGLKTSDGREFTAYLTDMAFGRISQNLEEGYIDCTGRLAELLSEGQFVHAYGVFYPDTGRFEVKSLVFPGEGPQAYRYEEPDWWVKQVRSIADSYLKWQFNYP